ncbi:hypothetical protein M0R45_008914 [Rubus argutus]|uniref:START domain-containing protein n=1 Tax=Rubus argutus TaxID=59490 RepID=A0AAW1Y4G7_RUBAR
MLRSWRSCPLEKKRATRRGRKLCQRSSCYQLLKFQLVKPSSFRYSHQQLDGSWIIVDVSVDEWRQFQRPSTRSICRKRPSGCLIRDLQNGSSFVTWVENVDVRDNTGSIASQTHYPLLSLGMHLERGAGSQIFKFKPSASSTPLESTLHPVTVPFHLKEEEALQ